MAVDQKQVLGIVGGELDANIDVDIHIQSATTLVDSLLSDAGHTAAHLETITAWVASHFYVVSDPRFLQQKSEENFETYQRGELGRALESTNYGQQAMILDTTGILARYNEAIQSGKVFEKEKDTGRRKAGVHWLGK